MSRADGREKQPRRRSTRIVAQFALPCTTSFYLPWLIHFLKIKRARIIFLKVIMTRFIHKNVLDTIVYNF